MAPAAFFLLLCSFVILANIGFLFLNYYSDIEASFIIYQNFIKFESDVNVLSNKMLKPTIISISMATVMAGAAISPALGLIASAFPNANPLLIKLILTAPSIMIIPFSFFSSYLTSKITKKMIVLIGLVIYLIGGVGSQFAPTIEILLIGRLILGAGVGLVMPLSMSLIHDHFTGKERVKMMGYNSAFSNFGGIVTIILAGYLTNYGWKAPFNVYFIGLIIFVLVYFYLPKNELITRNKTKAKAKMPLAVYGYAFAMGAVMLVYYSVSTNMAMFLEQNDIGDASLASKIIAFTTIGGMITSLILVKIQEIFKVYIIPIMLFGMFIAFTLLGFTKSVPLIMIAATLIGFGQGVLFPTIMLKAMNRVQLHQADHVVALTSSMTFIGQFLSPVVLDSIGAAFSTATIRFQYSFLSVIMIITVLITLIFTSIGSKIKNKNIAEEKSS